MRVFYSFIWLTIVGLFLACELANYSLTDWRVPVAIGVAFMTTELYCAFRRNGCTFSEFVWRFSERGAYIGTFAIRVFPSWLLASAMTLRIAGTARLIDGEPLVYIFNHGPLDLFLFGVVVWLFVHFASLGKYNED